MLLILFTFDFSRAFHSIVFEKLLRKLQSCGINCEHPCLDWCLLKQLVVADRCFSSVPTDLSGVLQGSVRPNSVFNIYYSRRVYLLR